MIERYRRVIPLGVALAVGGLSATACALFSNTGVATEACQAYEPGGTATTPPLAPSALPTSYPTAEATASYFPTNRLSRGAHDSTTSGVVKFNTANSEFEVTVTGLPIVPSLAPIDTNDQDKRRTAILGVVAGDEHLELASACILKDDGKTAVIELPVRPDVAAVAPSYVSHS